MTYFYIDLEFEFGDETSIRHITRSLQKHRHNPSYAIANVLYYSEKNLVFQRKIIYKEHKLWLHDFEGPAVIDHRHDKIDFFWYSKPVTLERFCKLAHLPEKKQSLLKLKYSK